MSVNTNSIAKYGRIKSSALGIFITIAVTMTVIGALYALSGNDGQAKRAIPALYLNLVLVMGLGIYLLLRVRRTLTATRQGGRAPRLHRRFLFIFSMAALVPAVLVGLFTAAIFSRNVNDIFGSDVRETMKLSESISDTYLSSERQILGESVLDIASDLNRTESQLDNRITYTAYLINQAIYRNVLALYVVNSDGNILAQAEGPGAPEFILPPPEILKGAQNGVLAYSSRDDIDFMFVLYKLENYKDAYLYTGRYVRTGVLAHKNQIEQIKAGLVGYSGNYRALNRVFLLLYLQVALLIVFAAIWLALILANRIVTPLGSMVGAAEKVRSGDLSTRVGVSETWDEINDLASAFNRMTRQLSTQRKQLVLEHDISEQRREFSEAVLSGVSAGVIGLTPDGKISVLNQSAELLLDLEHGKFKDKPLSGPLDAFKPVFQKAKESLSHTAQDQINIETLKGTRNLDVRVSPYVGDHTNTGWVITFDDMTRLVSAQRHAAWREVARRIAHEIKNPLTPILLSAERLERKYLPEIKSDPESFKSCTNVITRQVSNLGRMVDEFSAFARMPTPVLDVVDMDGLINEALFAQRVAFPQIEFAYTRPETQGLDVICDERLIGQALTNLYKNAGESILRRLDHLGSADMTGRIETALNVEENELVVEISDNGMGWPETDRDRLLEPYMTTRKEGSGLGLAIVKRIIEDHGGTFKLAAAKPDLGGAAVRLRLTLTEFSSVNQIPSSQSDEDRIEENL